MGFSDAVKINQIFKGTNFQAPHNPGPPATLDYMPIPCEPWAKVHGELQVRGGGLEQFLGQHFF